MGGRILDMLQCFCLDGVYTVQVSLCQSKVYSCCIREEQIHLRQYYM